MFKRIVDTISSAESFISGFEGDELQEGIDELLEELRSLDSQLQEQPPSVGSMFVYVDKLAPIDGAFWSNVDGWGCLASATLFSVEEKSENNPPFATPIYHPAAAIQLDQVPAFIAEKQGLIGHRDGSAGESDDPICLTSDGTDQRSDYRMVSGRSVWIDVRNVSVQLSLQDEGLSVYLFSRGSSESIAETYIMWAEAASEFFGDDLTAQALATRFLEVEVSAPNVIESHISAMEFAGVHEGFRIDAVNSVPAREKPVANLEHLQSLVLQTLAALPDPVFAARCGVEADAIRALQALVNSTEPAVLVNSLSCADVLVMQAWEWNTLNAPMELVYELRGLKH